MKDNNKNQLLGMVAGVFICAVGFWAFTIINHQLDERDHRHIRIGARAQFRADSMEVAKAVKRKSTESAMQESPAPSQRGKATSAELRGLPDENGDYRGRPIGDRSDDADMQAKADAVRDSADILNRY